MACSKVDVCLCEWVKNCRNINLPIECTDFTYMLPMSVARLCATKFSLTLVPKGKALDWRALPSDNVRVFKGFSVICLHIVVWNSISTWTEIKLVIGEYLAHSLQSIHRNTIRSMIANTCEFLGGKESTQLTTTDDDKIHDDSVWYFNSNIPGDRFIRHYLEAKIHSFRSAHMARTRSPRCYFIRGLKL